MSLQKKRKVIIPIALSLLFITSCKDKEEYRFDTSYNKETIRDFLSADAIYLNLFRHAYQLSFDTSILKSGEGIIDSAFIKKQGEEWLFTYKDEQACPDGSKRSGQFKIHWDAPLSDSNAQLTIFPQGLYINNKKIGGLITITRSTQFQAVFRMKVDTASISFDLPGYSEKKKIQYTGAYTYRWEKGSSTPYNIFDDVLLLTGTASGRGKEFDRFFFTTLDTLTYSFTCRYPRGGKASLQMPDLEINQIDLDYQKANECSALVVATLWGLLPNGSKTQNEKVNFTISY